MRTRDIVRLRFLARYVAVPIMNGPNRGLRWSIATRSTFVRGAFERSRCLVIAHLAEGCGCFWDLGAHYGYVTLIAARRMRAGARVYAIEPNLSNLWYLQRHVKWNRASNVTVLPCAVGHEPGSAVFSPVSSGTGLIVEGGDDAGYRVDVETVDGLVSSGRCESPTMMKVDIDHTHVDFLTGARETLTRSPCALIVATNNSRPIHERFQAELSAMGYRVVDPDRCRSDGPFHGIESELLAIGPGVHVDEDIIRQFVMS